MHRRRAAPLSFEFLEHEVLLQTAAGWCLRDGDKTVTVHPRGRFRADNGVALTSPALAGIGIALLPDILTDPHIESGALVPLLTEHTPPDVAI